MKITRRTLGILALFVAAAALTLATGSDADAAKGKKKGWKVPKGSVELAPGVFRVAKKKVNGDVVECIAILDSGKRSKARGGNKGKPDKPGGGGGGSSSCYSFLANGAKWTTAESYVVDPAVTHVHSSLTTAEIVAGIATGIAEWENAANDTSIFGSGSQTTLSSGARSSIGNSSNGANEVAFAAIGENGTIAVTFVWGVFSGPKKRRQILEWDQLYDDDGDWTWGDATVAGSAVMDFLNIAVHEVGHAMGMGHTDGTCTEETMFPSATTGETKKRDLNAGDIAGIRRLY